MCLTTEKIIPLSYDENNGRKKADTIHTVHVPYEQLSGNTYKVFSTHIIDELSYGGRSGKTIESEAVLFKDNLGEHFNILSVSDWHTHNEKAKKAVSCLEDYQAVILLGDCAPGMMFITPLRLVLIISLCLTAEKIKRTVIRNTAKWWFMNRTV